MQMRLFPALILFLGSYFPLSLILLIQDIKETSGGAFICKRVRASPGVFPLECAGVCVLVRSNAE
jgi:hypothetical protein